MAASAQRKMAGPNMPSAAKARTTITIARRLKIKSAMVSVSAARVRRGAAPSIAKNATAACRESPNPARV